MKQLRIICLALFALLALGAYASSMASAEEGVLEPLTSSGTGGTARLETEKEKIVCKEVKILEAKFLTEKEKDQHGTADLHFVGCKAEELVGANTLGDAAEVILVKVLFLVCLTNPSTLLFGLLIQPLETVHVEVPAVKALILIKGAVIAQDEEGQLKSKEPLFLLKGTKGKQTEALECEINGNKFKHTLEAAKDSEAKDKPASQEVHFTLVFPQVIEFMDK